MVDEVNLDQAFPVSRIPHTYNGGQGEGGMAWGSILWRLRKQLLPNKEKARMAIAHAWLTIKPTSPPQDYQTAFLRALASAGLDSSMVKNAFDAANVVK
jgi:hypothetical protein